MAVLVKRRNIWYVQYKGTDGKWKRKSCGKGAKKTDAEYIRKRHEEIELNNYHKAPVRMVEIPLVKALEEFRDKELFKGVNGREKVYNSVLREQTVINNFLAYLKPRNITLFRQVGKHDIEDYFEYRKKEHNIQSRTKREEIRVIRKFFNWSISSHQTTENPTEEIHAPPKQKKLPRYFSEEELAKIFESAKPPYDTIFKFLFLTGLRTGELANLKWSDWDKERRRIILRIISGDKKNRVPGNKTKREEEVPLNADAQAILVNLQKENGEHEHIFLNQHGNTLDNDNIYRNLKRLLLNQNIPDASPHTFRHSCASHLAIKGVSLYVIKELLRHRSIKETEIYAHLSEESVQKAVELLSL